MFYYGSEVDSWLLNIVLMPYISLYWHESPLWIRVIAPPSCGKTAHLSLVFGYDKTYPVDELTSKCFASGFKDKHNRDFSKLPAFDNHVLVVGDESSLMEQSQEERHAVQATLRRCYDGRFSKTFGNIKDARSFEFFFCLLVASTPQVDRYFLYTQALGERYLNFRMQVPDRKALAQRALDNSFKGKDKSYKRLGTQVVQFLRYLQTCNLNKAQFDSESVREELISIADFTACLRTPVMRDATGRQVTTLPQLEAGGRLVLQLTQAAIADAIIEGQPEVTERNIDKARYLALGSVRSVITYLLWHIYCRHEKARKERAASKYWFSTGDLISVSSLGRATISQALEDFALRGILKVRQARLQGGRKLEYRLAPGMFSKLNQMQFFKHYVPEAGYSLGRKDRARRKV